MKLQRLNDVCLRKVRDVGLLDPGTSYLGREVEGWEVEGEEDYFCPEHKLRYDIVVVQYTDGGSERLVLFRIFC